MARGKTKIIILKTGQRIRNKRDKIVYEVKTVNENSVSLMREDGSEYLVVPPDCITPAEYEPVYN